MGTVQEVDVKREVQAFYDSVGWTTVGDGLYQNARYEDLRPVVREYVHRCHVRVGRHLPGSGTWILDAGSGPLQYPEYLAYSYGYRWRVCLDLSRTALTEARLRLGSQGQYIVGDLANLPFKRDAFEGVVSLHALHHLPQGEQRRGLGELYRVLAPGGKGVVVYAWGDGGLLMRCTDSMTRLVLRWLRRRNAPAKPDSLPQTLDAVPPKASQARTHTYKHAFLWATSTLASIPGSDIRVWRTVNTGFTKAFIHRRLLGRFWLRLLYAWEEAAPHLLGRIGQYPMFTLAKPAKWTPRPESEHDGMD